MSLGGGGKGPPVPSPVPVERIAEEVDETGRMEAERIRRMRGRLATFLTKGILSADSPSTIGTNKLGT